jgi:hypothetical protein
VIKQQAKEGLTLIADFGVGFGLRGMSFQEQINNLQTTGGQIYFGLLAVFVVMPLLLSALPAIRRGVDNRAIPHDET